MAKEPSTLEADRAFLRRHPRAVVAFVISLALFDGDLS
jgi:hypothetical protein